MSVQDFTPEDLPWLETSVKTAVHKTFSRHKQRREGGREGKGGFWVQKLWMLQSVTCYNRILQGDRLGWRHQAVLEVQKGMQELTFSEAWLAAAVAASCA